MKIAPSVLPADFTNLKSEIDSISKADYIHIDIMDGNFVPNISFGPSINKQIANITKVPLDVHLMVLDPVKWISEFSIPQVKYITVHYEANDFKEALNLIKKQNIKTGLSIKPATTVETIKPYLKDLDMVLIMSVEPGFGGQKFMPKSLDKVKELVSYRKEHNLNFIIEIDGGMNKETLPLAKEAGVDVAVIGSYLFAQKDRNETMKKFR